VRLNPLMAIRVIAALTLAASLVSVPAVAQATSPSQTQQSTQTLPPPATQTQDPKPPAQTQPPDDGDDLPIDLSRMRTRLSNLKPSPINDGKIRFTLEVIAREQPTMKQFIGKDENLRYGAVKGSVMSHQEFLDMVNPKLLNSSAGFTATDTLQAALFNWAVQKAVKKGINAIKNARDEAEVRAIRAQIDRELAALRGGGQ